MVPGVSMLTSTRYHSLQAYQGTPIHRTIHGQIQKQLQMRMVSQCIVFGSLRTLMNLGSKRVTQILLASFLMLRTMMVSGNQTALPKRFQLMR